VNVNFYDVASVSRAVFVRQPLKVYTLRMLQTTMSYRFMNGTSITRICSRRCSATVTTEDAKSAANSRMRMITSLETTREIIRA